MKICILSGSPLSGSNTLRFCKVLKSKLELKGYEVKIIDFEQYDIPFLNKGELTPNNLSPFQQELIQSVEESRLVFVCSPEYNWMPSAELVNMFHQIGSKYFKSFFNNKVFAVAGISSGKGGKMPCIQMTYVLNKLINFLDCDSLVSSRNFESHFTHKELDEDGKIQGNEIYEKGIDGFIDYATRMSDRWSK